MPSQLGILLSKTRKEAGLSLREVAKRIRKSPAFMSMLENDDPPPAVKEETLAALAKELDLDLDRLLGLTGKVPEDALPDSQLDVALFRKIKTMSDEQKRRILRGDQD